MHYFRGVINLSRPRARESDANDESAIKWDISRDLPSLRKNINDTLFRVILSSSHGEIISESRKKNAINVRGINFTDDDVVA